MNEDPGTIRWGISWLCLALAVGLHVADEALTGFLPLYNSLVRSLRETGAWAPFPIFTFPVWLGGLIILVVALLALTPLVLRGRRWLRLPSYFLGVLMIVNALGHASLSVWLGRPAPGVYSSPVLLAAAIALLVTTARGRPAARPGGSG